jgi:hypothetical protein
MPRGRPKGGSMSEQVDEMVRRNVLDKNDLRSIVPKQQQNVQNMLSTMISPMGTKTDVIRERDDHIYYNVLIPNNYGFNFDNNPIEAKFIEVRGQPLIENPEEWEMSIVRFKLPTQEIPIFIAEVDDPVGFPNITSYSVTMTNGAVNSPQTFIVYVPDNSKPIPSFTNPDQSYYYVYSYQHFIDMINTAILNAFNDPTFNASLPVTGTPWAAPYMIYNPETKLISLIAQQQYATSNVNLYFNTLLFNFFDPIQAYFYGFDQPLGKDFLIKIKNNNNNSLTIPAGSRGAGTVAYQMEQEYNSLARWNSFSKFVFMTGSVPIRAENINTSTVGTISGSQSSTNTNFQPILTDFVPIVDPNVRTNVIYYPTAEYRMTDLMGKSPLTVFDLQVFWEDQNQILRPLYIPINESVNVKILFRKKRKI